MEDFLTRFPDIADGAKLTTLMALIFGNLLSGLTMALVMKTWQMKQVANFLLKRVIPYLLGYMTVAVVAVVEPSWEPAVTVVWGFIVAALVAAILQNLKEIGLPMPPFLNRILGTPSP